MEHYFAQNDFNREDKSPLENWQSTSDAVAGSDDSPSDFDCNICLDSVQDPVVTLCGHLYCWPCIYKWLHFHNISTEDQGQKQQLCPVCKAEVSPDTLVPLYGRGQTVKSSSGKAPHLGLVIPRRPLGPACGIDSPSTASPRIMPLQYHNHDHHQSQLYYSQPGSYLGSPSLSSGGRTTNVTDPMIGMFGEMVYARVFGNSITNMYMYPNSYHLAGSTTPRLRRHIMQADRSLNRICFFLLCSTILCLLLF